ncbi:glycosyltransferase N-terminal domain-containing protein [Zwartia sp.]|uniref:3-deoxy-D-manno-octulosonic acid transferase n=1 Tax=Zwartia sp. TaxID=2978004 RepID=UPI002720CD85|nr:glycosyltransferase N-terminal domain-containing protein [Zwartia sp.]MDO9024981.1 glycosyltransferase N-terminal domain-containing protein [Zwartia sp.]
MAQQAYTLLLRLFSPFIWGWMYWRARRAGGVWQIFSAERFGSYALPWDGDAPVWVHAVSLGETRAAQSLVVSLLARGDRVLLTHTTPTGRAEGAKLFAAEIATGQLRQQWLPYDFPGATRRFFKHYRPRLGLLIEREVWPNLIEQAQVADIPVILASARFSARAQGHVRRIDQLFFSLMRDTYASIDLVLAQTEDDARRLFEVGASNVQIVGNLKFDVDLPIVAVDAGRVWRERLQRPVVSIASTREGEDAMFVAAVQQQIAHPDLVIEDLPVQFDPILTPVPVLMPSSTSGASAIQSPFVTPSAKNGQRIEPTSVIAESGLKAESSVPAQGSEAQVTTAPTDAPLSSQNLPPAVPPLFFLIPRHPQRFEEAARLLEQSGLRFVRWSDIRHNTHADRELVDINVVLGDTLGEMPFFYAASDVAIVAGSFAPHGGQNLIEACAIGTPVIVGPFARNFADAVQGAVAAGAAIQIQRSELVDPALRAVATALSWLKEPAALSERGRLGREWVALHTGATTRILQHINDFEVARDQVSLPRR